MAAAKPSKSKKTKKTSSRAAIECAAACADSDGSNWGPVGSIVRVDRSTRKYEFSLDIDGDEMSGESKLKRGETALTIARDMVLDHVYQSLDHGDEVTWELAAAPIAASTYSRTSARNLSVENLAKRKGAVTETISNVDEGDEDDESEDDGSEGEH